MGKAIIPIKLFNTNTKRDGRKKILISAKSAFTAVVIHEEDQIEDFSYNIRC